MATAVFFAPLGSSAIDLPFFPSAFLLASQARRRIISSRSFPWMSCWISTRRTPTWYE